jgi:hypothetical protein
MTISQRKPIVRVNFGVNFQVSSKKKPMLSYRPPGSEARKKAVPE